MYDLKVLTPTYDNLPTVPCMYKVKRFGQVSTNNKAENNCAFDLNILDKKIELAANTAPKSNMIVERQQQVIEQLELLQTKLASIREKWKITAPLPIANIKEQLQKSKPSNQNVIDFVINAHPNQVPYALLALRNAWKNELNFELKVFKHSSIATIDKKAQYFEQQLMQQTQAASVNTTLPLVKISLVWSNCAQIELISSEALYVPIYGEVNVLRYLARIGPNSLSYENSNFANEIDALLDASHQLLVLKTPAIRKSLLNAISGNFKHEFLFGAHISVADIAVYSALKQVVSAKDLNYPAKELNTAFTAWRNRLQTITGF